MILDIINIKLKICKYNWNNCTEHPKFKRARNLYVEITYKDGRDDKINIDYKALICQFGKIYKEKYCSDYGNVLNLDSYPTYITGEVKESTLENINIDMFKFFYFIPKHSEIISLKIIQNLPKPEFYTD